MITHGANLPLHEQLKQRILENILSGELKADHALPGERQLAEDYGVSRTTVRSALNELVSEGTLYRRHGKGTYVAPPPRKQNLTWLQGFAEELRNQGNFSSAKVIKAEMRPAPAKVAAQLQLDARKPIAFIERLVSSEQGPVFLDRTYLVADIGRLILGADLANEPIYTIVERLGYPIREGLQTIKAVNLKPSDAKKLDVATGFAALAVERVTYVDKDSPIEYAQALYRSDRYQYLTRLQRYKATNDL